MAKRADLEPAYDLDNGDEIIDPVAVDILVLGQRKVDSTAAEKVAAIHRLVKLGAGVRDIAHRLGVSIDDAKKHISQAGYEVVPDPMYRKADGSDGNRNHIVKVGV